MSKIRTIVYVFSTSVLFSGCVVEDVHHRHYYHHDRVVEVEPVVEERVETVHPYHHNTVEVKERIE